MVHAAHRNPTVPEAYGTPMAIYDTLIHEIDVLRWLLDDDYVSARVLFPRKAARSHGKLRDPQVVVLETAKGVLIDISALDMVDSFIGRMIGTISGLSKIMDAETMLVGMQPAVAITLVELGLNLPGVSTALNVERGMKLLRERVLQQ